MQSYTFYIERISQDQYSNYLLAFEDNLANSKNKYYLKFSKKNINNEDTVFKKNPGLNKNYYANRVDPVKRRKEYENYWNEISKKIKPYKSPHKDFHFDPAKDETTNLDERLRIIRYRNMEESNK